MLYSSYCTLFNRIAFSLVLLAVPTAAIAEVSDKEPTLLWLWGLGATAAIICCIGACFCRWLIPVLAAYPFLWFVSFFIEIHAPDIGHALYLEQGILYYVQAYLSFILFLSGIILGLALNHRRRNSILKSVS